MARGLIGGMTDYRHQTLKDMTEDISNSRDSLKDCIGILQERISTLSEVNYWGEKVPREFRDIICYARKFYCNAQKEIEAISQEVSELVDENHVRRLRRIGEVASEINVNIGIVWHQQYPNKDYYDKNFRIVEDIYAETRDMAVDLLDLANLAGRLEDFVGKGINIKERNNPWIAGSFYLVAVLAVLALLGILSSQLSWMYLPSIIVGGIILICIIGILQLRNDDKLSNKSFVDSLKYILQQLPLVNHGKRGRHNN